MKENNGQLFFYNIETGQKQLEHPCDDYYKEEFLKAKDTKALLEEEAQMLKEME